MASLKLIARIEHYQRLVILLMLGFIPLVVDPNVMKNFVDTKFLMLQLLVLQLILTGALKLILLRGPAKGSWLSVLFLVLVGLYFLHYLPSLLPSSNPMHSLADPEPDFALLSALKYSLFFLIPLFFCSTFKTRKQVRAAEDFLLVMMTPFLIYALMQHWGIEFVKYQYEITKSNVHGTLGNSHFLGAYLAILVFVVLHRLTDIRVENESKGFVLRVLLILYLAVVLYLLVASRSRGAMLCMAAAGFGFLGIRALTGWRRQRSGLWKWVFVGWVSIWFILPAVFWWAGRQSESNPIRQIELRIHRNLSLNNRIVLSMAALDMWSEAPWWGIGLDQYSLHYFPSIYRISCRPDYIIFRKMVLIMESTQANETHNDFLQCLAEMGIVGFSVLTGICCFAVMGLVTLGFQRVRGVHRRDHNFVMFLAPALLTSIAQMLYSFPLHLPSNGMLVFAVFGFSMVLFRRYGLFEVQFPRWLTARLLRVGVALVLIAFSVWGTYTVMRQYLGLVYTRVGYVLVQEMGRIEPGRKFLSEAKALYPENGEIAFYQCRAYATDKDDYKRALAKLEEASRTFMNSSVRLVKSQLLLERFRFSEAIQELEPLSVVTTRLSNLHLARGMVYYHQGDFKQAVMEFEKELEVEPQNREALLYLAQSHFELGDYYLAEQLFLRAERRRIKNIDLHQRLGDIYSKHQFRPEEARKHYSQALKWALQSREKQRAYQLEQDMMELERKIRLKVEHPQFRSEIRSR